MYPKNETRGKGWNYIDTRVTVGVTRVSSPRSLGLRVEACYFRSLGVGWGGEGMGYSIVTQVETHCMIGNGHISAPQAKFFECSARLRSRKRDF